MSLEKCERGSFEKYKPEMVLLLALIRTLVHADNTATVWQEGSRELYWADFLQIVQAHQLSGMLTTMKYAERSPVPTEVWDKIRTTAFENARKNLRNFGELTRLHELLNKAGIRNTPYKGVLLSKLLFDDFVSRECSDIDFLIHQADFALAHELLIADGYRNRYYNPDFRSQFLQSSHELMYRKTENKHVYKIEIHWRVTSRMLNIPVPTNYLLEKATPENVLGKEVLQLDLTSHLLVILVHHAINDSWRSIRQCADLAVFVNRYRDAIDWLDLAKQTKKYRLYYASCVGFQLVNELFGVETPSDFRSDKKLPEAILDNLLQYPQKGKDKLNIGSFRRQLMLRDSFADRVRLLAAYLHAGYTPNVRDMEALRLPKVFYFLYYFIKPVRIVSAKFKPITHSETAKRPGC